MQESKLSKQIQNISISNFRELGGYKASNGKYINHNVFFRSSALYKLTKKEDIKTFSDFGIKTICDFRTESERRLLPDPVFPGIKYNYINSQGSINPSSFEEKLKNAPNRNEFIQSQYNAALQGYQNMPFNNLAYKQMFKDICEGNVPILIHCAGGKDRTGTAAALILLLFGVDKEDIVYDYMESIPYQQKWINDNIEIISKYVSKELADVAKEIFGCSRVYMEMTLNQILFVYGSTDKFFEEEYGISPQKRIEIIERYTSEKP